MLCISCGKENKIKSQCAICKAYFCETCYDTYPKVRILGVPHLIGCLKYRKQLIPKLCDMCKNKGIYYMDRSYSDNKHPVRWPRCIDCIAIFGYPKEKTVFCLENCSNHGKSHCDSLGYQTVPIETEYFNPESYNTLNSPTPLAPVAAPKGRSALAEQR